ncbi:hypothetical protein PS903_02627 [Pseudomonas fluorescens]|nr:hypothetical protein PS903_02627 [Pseudomonas fluorescens]
MPPSGVTRSVSGLLRAAMNARSLACSETGLLSRQKKRMHRSNILCRAPLPWAMERIFSEGAENVLAFFDQSLVWPRRLSPCARRL